jgi:hypothetical protein
VTQVRLSRIQKIALIAGMPAALAYAAGATRGEVLGVFLICLVLGAFA